MSAIASYTQGKWRPAEGQGGTPGVAGAEGKAPPARERHWPWNTSDESRTAGSLPWFTQ